MLLDDNVWSTINYLYAAVMYHIYHVWKTQHKTISNSGFVLKGWILLFVGEYSGAQQLWLEFDMNIL